MPRRRTLKAYRVPAVIRVCATSPAEARKFAEQYCQGYTRRDGFPASAQPEAEIESDAVPVRIA